jgi:hypothetical protein
VDCIRLANSAVTTSTLTLDTTGFERVTLGMAWAFLFLESIIALECAHQ